MKFINRCVVMLKPRHGFIDWVTGLAGELPEDWSFEGGSYFLDEQETEEALLADLKSKAHVIVENECSAWTDDENLWPEERGFGLLSEWFELHVAVAAFDLGKKPLIRVDLADVSFV